MKSIFGTIMPCQIAVICKDVETTKRNYAVLWGADVPPTVDGGSYEINQCTYMGAPAPEANCKMAFFDLGATRFEIIEPNGKQSTWQDFLDETGGGLHHIAYMVEDMSKGIEDCAALGMKLTQRGKYGDASGEYAYMDARGTLGCFIELLCNYPKSK